LQGFISKLETEKALLGESIYASCSIKIKIRRKRKMQKLKNKTLAIMIAVLLTASMGASMILVPTANAHTPAWTIPTYAYLAVNPNPVGIGQTVSVNFWLDKVPPTAMQQYGDRWQNFTVTVTKPDGTTETLGPFSSDASGGAFTTYSPTQLGNYTFVFNFGGQTAANVNPSPITGTQNPQNVGDYYQPSTSSKVMLTVQQAAVIPYPSTPLPTNYWTRPIFATNTNWYNISGNWLGLAPTSFAATGMYNATENFAPYAAAPNTAHIMWTKPYAFGGLIGGEFGNSEYGSNFVSTSQYEPKFAPIIMNGVLYYTWYPNSNQNPAGWVAVDLHTGQTIWTKNTTSVLRCGELLDYISPNQYGALAYLWASPIANVTRGSSGGQMLGNSFEMYDAMTGNYILSINMPFGNQYVNGFAYTLAEAADGSLLAYYIVNVNSTTSTLNLWNSTLAIQQYSLTSGQNTNTWAWRPAQGALIPWSTGVQWSVPMVTNMTADNGTVVNINAAYAQSAGLASPLAISIISDTIIVTDIQGPTTAFNQPGYIVTEGYSLSTGQLVWGPINQTETPFSYLMLTSAGDGAYTIFTKETMSWSEYSTTTGKLLWGPVTGPSNPWSFYEGFSITAYGNLYTADLGGNVNAFDVQTGKLLWNWTTGSSGTETPYGIWPIWHMDAVADGKIYIVGGHNYSPPLFHGAQLYCLNATSGKELWSINDFPITNGATVAIADGYLVEPNAYDNQIYAYGKGPSAMSVTAPKTSIELGRSVVIEGSVVDISAGTQQQAQAANFPNGVPAVSDASMTPFMEAIYMQQPMPTNTTGVPVSISVLDSNGNYRQIGSTTSNADGMYTLTWTPDIAGNYTVIASFAGSESYYPSHADTSFAVDPVAPTPIPATPAPQSAADMYFVPAVAGIIIAIVIATIINAMLLRRKRP
jgi:hypothetical protein